MRCLGCEQEVESSELFDRYHCINCSFRCNNCGDVRSFSYLLSGYENICEDCSEYCEDCEQSYFGNHECESIKSVLEYYSSRNVGYVNFDRKLKSKDKRMLLGLEIETNLMSGADQEEAKKTLQHYRYHFRREKIGILKCDGSVSGPEFAFEPCTYNYLKKEGFKVIDTIIDKTKNFLTGRTINGKTAGMHVHVNRKALNGLSVYNAAKFIYSPENRSFVTRIAQRPENQYCKYNLYDYEFSDNIDIGFFTNEHTNHYSALNIHGTYMNNTIEFRIFQASWRLDRITKNVEFVHSLLNFAGSSAFKNDVGEYLNYLGRSKQYLVLKNFLREEVV